MKLLLKAALVLILLFWGWNKITCQFCPKAGDLGSFTGSTMTMRECAIHGENLPITRAFVWVGWQVNVWMPVLGCYSNNPEPLRISAGPIKITIDTWFKGWHQIKMVRLRLK